MNRLLTPSVVALTLAAPFSVKATTDQVFLSGGGSESYGAGFTSCSFVQVVVDTSQNGTHNLSATATNGSALIIIFVENFCAGTYLLESGWTTNFQFNAPGMPNVIPNSLTASGTISADCYGTACPNSTDSLTFSVALRRAGIATFNQTESEHSTVFDVTRDVHYDSSLDVAAGTVTLSSQNLALPISSWSNWVLDSKSHTVTISH